MQRCPLSRGKIFDLKWCLEIKMFVRKHKDQMFVVIAFASILLRSCLKSRCLDMDRMPTNIWKLKCNTVN